MKKAFIFIAHEFDTSCVIKIMSEDGYLISAFETKNPESVKRNIQKFTPKGHYLEWIQTPYANADLFTSFENYARNYGVDMNGKVLGEISNDKTW